VGRVVLEGTMEEFKSNGVVKQAYLGGKTAVGGESRSIRKGGN